MQFSISRREACAIVGICVIFSPLIAVGAAGYGVVAGSKAARYKMRSSRAESKERSVDSILTKQRSVVMDEVGAAKFQQYLQEVYDRVKASPGFDSHYEYAAALFLNGDIVTAEEVLQAGIGAATPETEPGRLGAAQYLLGIVQQHLGAYELSATTFEAAAANLERAGDGGRAETAVSSDGNTVPKVTLADAVNAQGYAYYMTALYGSGATKDQRDPLLLRAIECYEKAMRVSQVPEGVHNHNRALAKYYLAVSEERVDPYSSVIIGDESTKLLNDSFADWDVACSMDNFDGDAVARSMQSQVCCLLLQRAKSESYLAQARELDPAVFNACHFDDLHQCAVPWPIPPVTFSVGSESHDFRATRFMRPTWCDCCMEFITLSQNNTGKCGECRNCGTKVHEGCIEKLRNRPCWVALHEPLAVGCTVGPKPLYKKDLKFTEGTLTSLSDYSCTVQGSDGNSYYMSAYQLRVLRHSDNSAVLGHVHKLVEKKLHRPHWCDQCKKFIANLKGYKCSECPLLIHKECVGGVANAVVA